jgi:hypothetical protein
MISTRTTAIMVIGTPLEDREDVVGETVVCGGEDEGIPCGVDVMMTGVVLMYGEGPHSLGS